MRVLVLGLAFTALTISALPLRPAAAAAPQEPICDASPVVRLVGSPFFIRIGDTVTYRAGAIAGPAGCTRADVELRAIGDRHFRPVCTLEKLAPGEMRDCTDVTRVIGPGDIEVSDGGWAVSHRSTFFVRVGDQMTVGVLSFVRDFVCPDVTRDHIVDIDDLRAVAQHMRESGIYDVDFDGMVTSLDLHRVQRQMGKTCDEILPGPQ